MEYVEIARAESVAFMETLACGAVGELERVDFFTSHEALLLPYEQAQIRRVPRRPGWYLLSTHLPWIGMRTADPDGAHVELCRGLRNPVGVKVGPAMTGETLVRLVERLDPADEPGRLVLIHRFGAGKIAEHLPRLLAAVRETGRRPLWVCDPMHGNTERTAAGLKTRRFEAILEEVETAIEIHQDAVAQIRNGKMGTFGFLVGQVMKATGGKANPKLVNELLRRELQLSR